MALSIKQKYNIRQFLWVLGLGIVVGFLYPLVNDGWNQLDLINGTTAGLIIGALVAYLELFVFTSKLRRASFIHLFLLRVAIYMVIAFSVTLILFVTSRVILFELSFREVWYSNEFQSYLNTEYHLVLAFIFLVIFLVVFGLQLSRRLGIEDIIGFISGKYRTPKKEQRIFMFLQLDTNVFIKKSDELTFHKFLNDIIHNISDIIRLYKGKIVHYMDDQIVLVWTIRHGTQKASCVRTYFHICKEIANNAGHYQKHYGIMPSIRCALHCGTAVRAEIGEIKSEIAYFGDVLNTTSRILMKGKKNQCRRFDQ